MKLFWIFVIVGVLMAWVIDAARAQTVYDRDGRALRYDRQIPPLPYRKQGQCASGYRESGGFCAPTSAQVRRSFPKPEGQQCPSGYAQSGSACQEIR